MSRPATAPFSRLAQPRILHAANLADHLVARVLAFEDCLRPLDRGVEARRAVERDCLVADDNPHLVDVKSVLENQLVRHLLGENQLGDALFPRLLDFGFDIFLDSRADHLGDHVGRAERGVDCRVNHRVVGQVVPEAAFVERPLPLVRVFEELLRRLVGRRAREFLDVLHPRLLGRDEAGRDMVRHIAQEEERAATHNHAIPLAGDFKNHRAQIVQVPVAVFREPVEKARLPLVEFHELFFGQPFRDDSVLNLVLVVEGVAEPSGDEHSDFIAERA